MVEIRSTGTGSWRAASARTVSVVSFLAMLASPGASADVCGPDARFPGVEVGDKVECDFMFHYRKANDDPDLPRWMGLPGTGQVRSIAVLVAVDQYPGLEASTHDHTWDLPAARNDIDALAATLRDAQQFDEIYVVAGASATQKTVRYFLSEFLGNLGSALSGPARILIAYSGHGIGASSAGSGFLVTADTRTTDRAGQMIPFDDLTTYLRAAANHKDWQVLALINACHGGTLFSGLAVAPGEPIGSTRGSGAHLITAGSAALEVPTSLPSDSDDGKVYSLFFFNLFRAMDLLATDHAKDALRHNPVNYDTLKEQLAESYDFYENVHPELPHTDKPWHGAIPNSRLEAPEAGFILFPKAVQRSRPAADSATPAGAAGTAEPGVALEFSEADFWKTVTKAGQRRYFAAYLALFPDGPHRGEAEAGLASASAAVPEDAASGLMHAAWGARVAEVAVPAAPSAPAEPLLDTKAALDSITQAEWNAAPAEAIVARIVASGRLDQLDALAEGGDPHALWLLGLINSQGLMGRRVDTTAAAKHYLRAAQRGSSRAANSLGSLLENSLQAHGEAAKWYEDAAGRGNSFGQANLGRMCRAGRWVPPDAARALELFHASAQQGNAYGQALLGVALTERGRAEDLAGAVDWFRKSAGQGNAYGQTLLGMAYLDGRGVVADRAQATVWLQHAADQGAAEAQARLAYVFASQGNTPGSAENFVKWAKRAAEGGSTYGRALLAHAYQYGLGGLPASPERAAALRDTAAR